MEDEKQKLDLKVTESDSDPTSESSDFELEKGFDSSANSAGGTVHRSEISDSSQLESTQPEPSEQVRHAEYVRIIDLDHRRRARAKLSNFDTNDSLTMSVVGFLLFCFFSMMTYSTIWSYPWQSSWAHTDGQVDTVTYSLKLTRWINYSYSVGTQTFSGKTSFQLHGFFLFPNQKVHVRYDPKSPAFSVIETGPTLATLCWLVAALASFGFVVGGITKPR